MGSICPSINALSALPSAAKSNNPHYQSKVFVSVSVVVIGRMQIIAWMQLISFYFHLCFYFCEKRLCLKVLALYLFLLELSFAFRLGR